MSRRRVARGSNRRVVTAKGPGDLVAAVPYLIGFTPTRSIVLASLRGPRLRLGLVARLDLPEHGATERAVRSLCDFVRRDSPREVVVLVYNDRPWQRRERPGQHLVDAIEAELSTCPAAAAGGGRDAGELGHPVPVNEALYVTEERYWSYTCTSDWCCPDAGRPLSDTVASPIAATYVLEGRSPFADRQQLAARVAVAGPLTTAAVGSVADSAVQAAGPWWGREETRAWSRWQHQSLATFEAVAHRYIDGGRAVTPDEAGRVLAGLLDAGTRDLVASCWTGWCQALPVSEADPAGPDPLAMLDRRTAVGDLPALPDLGEPAVQEAIERLLVDLATCTDGGLALAPLTVLAMHSWSRGDGALAGVATDRALALDPTYPLAGLVDALLRSGLAPRWVAADRAADEAAGSYPTSSCG